MRLGWADLLTALLVVMTATIYFALPDLRILLYVIQFPQGGILAVRAAHFGV